MHLYHLFRALVATYFMHIKQPVKYDLINLLFKIIYFGHIRQCDVQYIQLNVNNVAIALAARFWSGLRIYAYTSVASACGTLLR